MAGREVHDHGVGRIVIAEDVVPGPAIHQRSFGDITWQGRAVRSVNDVVARSAFEGVVAAVAVNRIVS